MAELGKVIVEKGEVTPEQFKEIESGEFITPKEVAEKFRYTYAWVLWMIHGGRIKAVKPLGGRWRIPRSEYERILKEGVPPMPREETPKPKVTEITIPKEIEKKIMEPPKKEERRPSPSLFGLDFTGLFGGGKK